MEIGNGSWLLKPITELRRESFSYGNTIIVNTNDVFTIIATDDVGSYDVQLIGLFSSQTEKDTSLVPPKRWHIAMLKNVLVWISHDDLNFCELIGDV